MPEMMIRANGVELCVEAFGDPTDPAIVLLSGGATSMLGWRDDFCEALAAGSRLVIRYDYRDTGRSVTYSPGEADYRLTDLSADLVGILDRFELSTADLVGLSLGGGLAQLTAMDHPDRVASLTLIASSPVGPGGGDSDMDWMTPETLREFESMGDPPTDREGLIEYLVTHERLCASRGAPFDTADARATAAAVVDRALDLTAMENHQAVAFTRWPRERLSEISAPTLVVHGTDDLLLPYRHGLTLAEEIPGAQLLTLEGCGHELPRRVWSVVVAAILKHTQRS